MTHYNSSNLVNYEPVECKIFEENKNKCFEFWDRVSSRYSQKGIFQERGGYPDKQTQNTIKTSLLSHKSLPYKVTHSNNIRGHIHISNRCIITVF